MTAVVITLLGLLVKRLHLRGKLCRGHQQAVIVQVIKQGGCLCKKQWQIVLNTRRRNA